MKKYKVYLKSIAIVMITQGVVYFLIKVFLGNYNLVSSFLDVPLIKGFVYFYDSWYPVIALTAFIIYINDFDNYKSLLYTMLLGALMSHITFLIYPTYLTRPEIIGYSLTDLILKITYATDTPAVNCLPSVHCLFCFIGMYYTFKTKKLQNKYKGLIIVYLFFIVLSTLFIKQHIIEDVLLAFAYAVISIFVVYKFKDKFDKLLKFMF